MSHAVEDRRAREEGRKSILAGDVRRRGNSISVLDLEYRASGN